MIVEQVREAVRASGLLGVERPLVAMVSGGRDSVCLLDVMVAVRGVGDLRVLHVNYGLRGEESDADERHCAALCQTLGVASSFEVVRTRRPAGETGNLQAWARDVRYAAAMRMAAELDAGRGPAPSREGPSAPGSPAQGGWALVAAGHTASDQVETILYRLAASPGRRALLGMKGAEGPRLVRPLLGVTRAQTGAYCEARGLAWREDASNDSDAYARGRVRNGLVAALRAVHPAAEANVLGTARLLREETELLDGLVEDVLAGGRSIAIARLQELPAALARLVVVRLAEQQAGVYVPQAGARVAEILELGRRGRGRMELHVGGQVGAVIEHGVLSMVKLPPR